MDYNYIKSFLAIFIILIIITGWTILIARKLLFIIKIVSLRIIRLVLIFKLSLSILILLIP